MGSASEAQGKKSKREAGSTGRPQRKGDDHLNSVLAIYSRSS
jgi:hypothetical protein